MLTDLHFKSIVEVVSVDAAVEFDIADAVWHLKQLMN